MRKGGDWHRGATGVLSDDAGGWPMYIPNVRASHTDHYTCVDEHEACSLCGSFQEFVSGCIGPGAEKA